MMLEPRALPLPRVLRARGWRLYTEGGKRFLDCYQNEGLSLLGHRPAGLVSGLKNTMERGLLAPLPSGETRRIARHVADLLPPDFEQLRVLSPDSAARILGHTLPEDPLTGHDSHVMWWRPFTPDIWYVNARVLVLRLPYPVWPAPLVFAFRSGPDIADDAVSEVHLFGLKNALTGLVKSSESYTEEVWSRFDNIEYAGQPVWTRKGPYLLPVIDEELYISFARDVLLRGILVNPSWGPSIVPGEFTAGEIDGFSKASRAAESV